MSLLTSGLEMTKGLHYWEVQVGCFTDGIYVGVSRPNLDPIGEYDLRDSTDGWFIAGHDGSLNGNGKENDDQPVALGAYHGGDIVGVLLNLDDRSLKFFRNGARHGPGYPAGSVTGPVVHAMQLSGLPTEVALQFIGIPPFRQARLLPTDRDWEAKLHRVARAMAKLS
jgi:hypothetical protein